MKLKSSISHRRTPSSRKWDILKILHILPGIDNYFLSGLLIISFIIWWPTRLLPYHWDTSLYIIPAAQELVATNYSDLIPKGEDFAHPPLLPILLSILFQFTTTNLLIPHLFMLPFLPILVLSTYAFARYFQLTATQSFLTSLLVAITPFVVSEYGQIYLELPASALGFAAYTLWIYRHHKLAVISLSFAVMFKISPLVFVPFMVLHTYLYQKKHFKIHTFLPLLIPILIQAFWLFYHTALTGWLLVHPDKPTSTPEDFSQWLRSIQFILYVFFWRQGRWLLTILVFVVLILRRDSVLGIAKRMLPQLTLLITPLLLFSFSGEYMPRYSLSTLPLFYIFPIFLFRKLTSVISIPVLLISFLLILNSWYSHNAPDTIHIRVNEQLDYLDIIHTQQDLVSFLYVQNLSNTQIFGGFPENFYLTDPIHGYVNMPFHLTACNQFARNLNLTQLYILHNYHFSHVECQSLLSQHPAEIIFSTTHHDKSLQLYLFQ